MDFQLKTLGLAQAASEKADALIVLVSPGDGEQAPGALGGLIGAARKAGDLPDKAGKCLMLYRPQGIAAARVVLSSLGDGPAATAARSAVLAAWQQIKAANPKRVVLVWSGGVVPADKEGVEIVVSDNGIGIKEELIPKVFDMFFRAYEKTEGIGMGLYLTTIGVE